MTSSVMTRMPRSWASWRNMLEVMQRAVVRMDAVVIGDVIAVVFQRRRIKGQQPERRDAEVLEVIEFFGKPLKVADAVAVAVAKGAHVNFIDHRVFVPLRVVLQEQ